MILLIDNYDSFVYNLARYFDRLGQTTRVVRNDEIDLAAIDDLRPSAIVLSPGPCGPAEAGRSLDIVQAYKGRLPILGICLGHQTIAAAFGANIVRSSPRHGQTSEVLHGGVGVFCGVPNPFEACRYHSLVIDERSLPAEIAVTARTNDGIVMGIAHRTLPVAGLQFHPESILTKPGYQILANFLSMAGFDTPDKLPTFDDELRTVEETAILPDVPVTF